MAVVTTALPQAAVRMAHLVECLCAELNPGVCYCGPFYGGDTPIDYCSCEGDACGQAWVRLVQAYPSSTFPLPDDTGTCVMPLAYEWEVGVARCAPTVDEQGNLPDRDANLAATVQQYEDMIAMRRAIACCFASGDIDYQLGIYTPQPVLSCNVTTWQVYSR